MKKATQPLREASRLLEWFQGGESCLVAFSGGLDSSVVAKAASVVLGNRAVAVMAESETCFQGEVEQARAVAASIPIRFESFRSSEMRDPEFTANGPDRCYHCKRLRFEELVRYAEANRIERVVDGSNRDDLSDYRPGRKAVEELGIRAPLAELGFGKETIRRIARAWGLATSEKPASPCLATRIAYGLPITNERLRRIERAEAFLGDLGFAPLRVRLHPGELARIELAREQFERFSDPEFRDAIVERFKDLGFLFVSADLVAFRSGSMNVF